MDPTSSLPTSLLQQQKEQQQQQQRQHNSFAQRTANQSATGADRPFSLGTIVTSTSSEEPSTFGQGPLKRERDDYPLDKALPVDPGKEEPLDYEDEEAEKPLRRKRRVKGKKICGVCSDLAQSHNFGALTCETCKAFFRRNAFKQKELQMCVFNSSCTITKSTRRFCAPCRLKKCFAIGMDPDLILGEDEKLERHRKRTEGKGGRMDSLNTLGDLTATAHSNTSAYPSFPSSPASLVSSPSSSGEHAKPASSHDMNHGSASCNDDPRSMDSGFFAGACSCRPTRALGIKFHHAADRDLPKEVKLYWSLTLLEREKLDQLTSTLIEIMLPPWEQPEASELGPTNSMEEISVEKVMLAVDIVLRKFVKFSKSVPEFCQLQQQDQITLLKSAAMRFYCLRLAHSYIPHRRTWVTNVGEMSESAARLLFKDNNLPVLLNTIINFSEGVEFVFQGNPSMYALLKVLVLFDPRDHGLSDNTLVNTFKDHYLLLLKHYLEARFSFTHAQRYLTEMMQVYEDLDDLGHDFVNFFTNYPSQLHPLIAEFLSF